MRRVSPTRVVPTVLALLPIVVAAALLATLPLTPATAGGPTSVLLSVPGEGRTASLYYTDPEYDALAQAVGAMSERGVDEVEGSHQVGTPVTLTWLIHDVTPWRVDQVYVDGGEVWISTQESPGGGSLAEQPPVWHRGTPALARLLDRVLPDEGSATGAAITPPPLQHTPAGRGPAGAATGPAEADTSPWTLAAWAGGGLVAGAALTLLTLRRRTAPVSADRPAATDQLVWP
jgi:hypothetical protein